MIRFHVATHLIRRLPFVFSMLSELASAHCRSHSGGWPEQRGTFRAFAEMRPELIVSAAHARDFAVFRDQAAETITADESFAKLRESGEA